MKRIASILINCQDKLIQGALSPYSKHNGYYRVIGYLKKNWKPNLSLRISHLSKLLKLSPSYLRKCVARLIKSGIIQTMRKGFSYIVLSTTVFQLTRSSNKKKDYNKMEHTIINLRKKNAIESYEWYRSNLAVQKEMSVQDFQTFLVKIRDGQAKFYKELGMILSGLDFYLAEKLRKEGKLTSMDDILQARYQYNTFGSTEYMKENEKKKFNRQLLEQARGWYRGVNDIAN